MTGGPIPALVASDGHRFVFYGDACSGVAGAPHEAAHARVNAVVARLHPPPEFILFPGDEVIGLTPDMDALRAQWRHWWGSEMAWRDQAVPVWTATGNHTAWDAASEAVFAEMNPQLPRNGPPGQEGLAYHVRHGDLQVVVVHTLASALGGEGHVELDWLDRVLAASDARHRLVMGHHPVFPVNGFSGDYQRQIGPEYRDRFWDILVRHGVTAYLCSHILAFDVQCRRGVLQVTSAGAGTLHRMPEGVEYLHAVQMALDDGGLRYQVLDDGGTVRERLDWPPPAPSGGGAVDGSAPLPDGRRVLRLRLEGTAGDDPRRHRLAEAVVPDGGVPLWIGLAGPERRLVVQLQPEPGRSPHIWLGPSLKGAFAGELMLHPGMGPGGMLWRGAEGWSSLDGASAWGLERLDWPGRLDTAPEVRAVYWGEALP